MQMKAILSLIFLREFYLDGLMNNNIALLGTSSIYLQLKNILTVNEYIKRCKMCYSMNRRPLREFGAKIGQLYNSLNCK